MPRPTVDARCAATGCKALLAAGNKYGYCNHHKGLSRRAKLVGQRFGRLTVVDALPHRAGEKSRWSCRCECGRTTESDVGRLRSGRHLSCGCLLREKAAERMRSVQKRSVQARHLSAEQVQQRIDRTHGVGLIQMEPASYRAVFIEAKFNHAKYGPWCAKPINVYRGASHPDDGRARTNESLRSRKLTEREINCRLPEHVRIVPGTLRASSKTATFIDAEYGEWPAIVSNVLQGSGHPTRGLEKQLASMRASNLVKYGVEFVAQVPELALKASAGQNKTFARTHWQTGTELHCHGSWEASVVDYLNANRVKFEWQPKTFKVPLDVLATGAGRQTTFRPDLYLTAGNRWVEIKGWLRQDAEKKWKWFQSVFPNAELWDLTRLRELGILNSDGRPVLSPRRRSRARA